MRLDGPNLYQIIAVCTRGVHKIYYQKRNDRLRRIVLKRVAIIVTRKLDSVVIKILLFE